MRNNFNNQRAARDPCPDCRGWTQKNRPDLWRAHVRALHSNDIGDARTIFKKMLATWSAAVS